VKGTEFYSPFIGMLIVVSRSSVMPASRRPDIDEPMMASLLNATVAGPYMYFTVTSPVFTNTFII
jgi:hypothetical protein